MDVYHNYFPVGLVAVENRHDPEDFDLLDLPNIADLFSYLTDVQWVVITFRSGFGMGF